MNEAPHSVGYYDYPDAPDAVEIVAAIREAGGDVIGIRDDEDSGFTHIQFLASEACLKRLEQTYCPENVVIF